MTLSVNLFVILICTIAMCLGVLYTISLHRQVQLISTQSVRLIHDLLEIRDRQREELIRIREDNDKLINEYRELLHEKEKLINELNK